MDGIINFNKPADISSAKALYRVRKITGVRKSGHAGTLDPAATGVLILCLGKATKLVERLMDQPKVYRATARLDVTSESFDSDRPLIDVPLATVPSRDDVCAALRSFEGVIQQTPPAISAIKVGGQPAYKLARKGQLPTLKPRQARVYWIHPLRFAWPLIEFDMACGRGTYVRALIRDVGLRLGTGGCLTALSRTAIGPFRVEDAWSFEALEGAAGQAYLIPLERALHRLDPASIEIPERPGPTSKTRAEDHA